ncbi:MAG TPA: T9SS type A sorting domain-containing protein, partial [Flavisolibacter sp.]|nr:T9SS type A sorting domain-containing protein [Flavisolibacter sp.]
VATHLGTIKNLPANYTTNGAVVDGDGNLVVSSAVDGSAYYTVSPKDWTATPYLATAVYKSSDLANSNYLSTRSKNNSEIPVITRAEERFSKLISVYPNPIITNRINIQFNKVPAGDYTLELTDVLGRSVMQRQIRVSSESEAQTLPLSGSNTKGIYMVKVFDEGKQSVFSQKVVVQ